MSDWKTRTAHEAFRLIYSLPENELPRRPGTAPLAMRTAVALRLVADLVEMGHVTAVACAFYDGD